MPFSSWRGVVGNVKPTMRPGSGLEDLIRMLPRGVSVIPLYNNIREGSREEFKAVLAGYEEKTAELARAGCDVVHCGGAPPFMLLGYEGERELISAWEQRYGIPVFTSGSNHVEALRALGATSFVGASYFPDDLNAVFARYFSEAGFDVVSMTGIEVQFDRVQELSSLQVYAFVKRAFLASPGADAVYLLGTGWPALEVVEMLENDLGVPVVHAIPAQCWEIQRRLHIHEPVRGFGCLVEELP